MQGVVLVGIFIKVTPYAAQAGMGNEQVIGAVEKYIRKYFGKRGEKVVNENLSCVRRGLEDVQEVPRAIIETATATAPRPAIREELVFAK